MLLACAAGSFVLVNAVVRDEDAASSRSPVMRIAALVLALGILPLTVFAAISLGTRVSAYGLSPERLWGLIAIAVACAYGLAYLVAVLRGRKAAWREKLRGANLHLAAGTCVVALILALPILDFGAISAASQVSRLHSGKVKAEDFDYNALKWDFGDAGRRALAGLARSSSAGIAKLAREAQARTSRPWSSLFDLAEPEEQRQERLVNIRLEGTASALRGPIEQWVTENGWACKRPCVFVNLGAPPGAPTHVAYWEGEKVLHLLADAGGKLVLLETVTASPVAPTELKPKSKVEIRPFVGRQIFIDGEAVGEPFQ
jgi:hypothetical protein